MADFPFFKMAAVRHLGFSKVGNFNYRTLLMAKVRHHANFAKFREDRSKHSGDMADFRFLKMAAAILHFGNFKFLTVGTLKIVKLRPCAKFCRNRSKRG